MAFVSCSMGAPKALKSSRRMGDLAVTPMQKKQKRTNVSGASPESQRLLASENRSFFFSSSSFFDHVVQTTHSDHFGDSNMLKRVSRITFRVPFIPRHPRELYFDEQVDTGECRPEGHAAWGVLLWAQDFMAMWLWLSKPMVPF